VSSDPPLCSTAPVDRGPRARGFHARAASVGWNAILTRRYLGLSVATHILLLSVGAAFTALVIGSKERHAEGTIAVRIERSAEPEPESPVESASEDLPEEPFVPDPEEVMADDPLPEADQPDDDASDRSLEPVLFPETLPLGWDLRPPVPVAGPEPAVLDPPPPADPEDALPAAADAPPAFLEAPPPRYPPRARRAGLEGSVDCVLTVEADGRVSSVRVLRSSGHPLLDDAARRALGRWVFRPGLRAGVPDRFEVEHRVTFRLKG